MCNCNKKSVKEMSPEQLKGLEDMKELRKKKAIEVFEYKKANNIDLSDRDICPFCTTHLRHYCKNGCIIT